MKKLRRYDIELRKKEVLELIEKKESKAFISRILHCKVSTLETYLKRWGITYKGNMGSAGCSSSKRKTYEEYIKNPNAFTLRVKEKLFQDNIKQRICEICGNDQWLGKPIPLELHHIDGNRYNHKLDNLQILCSNCHAQTENHSGRATNKNNIKKIIEIANQNININYKDIPIKKINQKKYLICENCKRKIIANGRKKYCSLNCYKECLISKIPSKKELFDKFKIYKSFLQVGKYYGVSDNAVRKWCKKHNILEKIKK